MAHFLFEDTPEATKEKKRINLGITYSSSPIDEEESEEFFGSPTYRIGESIPPPLEDENLPSPSPPRRTVSSPYPSPQLWQNLSSPSPPPRQNASSISPPGFEASPPTPPPGQIPRAHRYDDSPTPRPREFFKSAIKSKTTDPNLFLRGALVQGTDLTERSFQKASLSNISAPPHKANPGSSVSVPLQMQARSSRPNLQSAPSRTQASHDILQSAPPRPQSVHSRPKLPLTQPPSARPNVELTHPRTQPPSARPNVESAPPVRPNLESTRPQARSSRPNLQHAPSHPQSVSNLPRTQPPPARPNVESAPARTQPPSARPNVESASARTQPKVGFAQPGTQSVSSLEHPDKFLASLSSGGSVSHSALAASQSGERGRVGTAFLTQRPSASQPVRSSRTEPRRPGLDLLTQRPSTSRVSSSHQAVSQQSMSSHACDTLCNAK